MEEKVCVKCGSDGPFPPGRNVCVVCTALYDAERYQRLKDTPVYHQHKLVAAARYRDRFPERNRASSRKYYHKKKGKIKMFEIEIADEGTTTVVEVEAEDAQDALGFLDQSGQFSDDALALSVVEK